MKTFKRDEIDGFGGLTLHDVTILHKLARKTLFQRKSILIDWIVSVNAARVFCGQVTGLGGESVHESN